DGCLDRLGVRHVPLLILTHSHADHIDGTAGVRSDRTVHSVLVTPSTFGREARHASSVPMRAAAAGQHWTIGDLTLTVLGPPPTAPRLSASDEGTELNNASIVLVARAPGFSTLLSGDVELDAQRALASSVPPVQVLKVPHHGSRSQDPAFFSAARAPISIISVGKENDYGHPSPATLALLHRQGTRTHRTDQDGDIAITRTGAGLSVVTRH
ncbi:ComEC/Rec2 family competence protein, partial [Actinomadura adrarensis]